jgi:hypothetical protein
MHLSAVLVRFYRSFNFDYERKARSTEAGAEWEHVDGAWYPFIRVDLEGDVTAVVGANESGKSHLIDVVDKALTGRGIERSDFCRYSPLYSVERGQVRKPDVGFELKLDSTEDGRHARGLPGGASLTKGRSVVLLRMGGGELSLLGADGDVHTLDEDQLKSVQAWLPAPFKLRTDVPLPDSISFDALLERGRHPLSSRKRRARFFDRLRTMSAEEDTAARDELFEELLDESPEKADERRSQAEELARLLLLRIARIDEQALIELEQAVRDGHEGRAGGLIGEMNRSLARHLNVSSAWRQDRDFQLGVQVRERELSLTISDRTGRDYSFDERSRGLTYFLSYFVQLLAHQRPGRPEILLMDEPDAYLSSAGQQDLLRILERFAATDGRADQVLYVTHSPFLINRNAPHRIRVLDKGTDEEGSRVVRDVARNRYEPLRSAIGAFVAETAFIGGANLIVEGPADQVLLAGMNTMLRDAGLPPRDLLDLNEITLVAAGGASSVPYMAYLARGRGEIKPACVALLDGDKAGREAAGLLRKRTPVGRPVLDDEHIVLLSEWMVVAEGTIVPVPGVQPVEPEDLLPLDVVVSAARSYAAQLVLPRDASPDALDVSRVEANLASTDGRVWGALQNAFAQAYSDAHIDKVGFAREVVGEAARRQAEAPNGTSTVALRTNFGALIAHLASRLAAAVTLEVERRSRRRVSQLLDTFARDHPTECTRDEAEMFLRELLAGLEDTSIDDDIRRKADELRRTYRLAEDPLAPVVPYDEFARRLSDLRYVERLAAQDPPTPVVTADVAPKAGRRKRRSSASTSGVARSGPSGEIPDTSEAPTQSSDD